MTEATILYSGGFCLLMILLGVALTVLEFRKDARLRAPSAKTDSG